MQRRETPALVPGYRRVVHKVDRKVAQSTRKFVGAFKNEIFSLHIILLLLHEVVHAIIIFTQELLAEFVKCHRDE